MFLIVLVLLWAIPFTVEVIRVWANRSSLAMRSSLGKLGFTNEQVHWSSIMASPSMERPEFEWLRRIGHVRLNDFVNSVCP